jgi:hypothetical protein
MNHKSAKLETYCWLSPPKRYRTVPTADIACPRLALGPVPAASKVVHSIETVENFNNSADETAHGPHARSGLTASQQLLAIYDLMRRGVP